MQIKQERGTGMASIGLAKAAAIITCILSTQAVAQDGDASTTQPPVYSSLSEARSDPAFTNGVVIQTDDSFLVAVASADILLNDMGIHAAIANDGVENGMVRFFLDGQTSDQVHFSEREFIDNSGAILRNLRIWHVKK